MFKLCVCPVSNACSSSSSAMFKLRCSWVPCLHPPVCFRLRVDICTLVSWCSLLLHVPDYPRCSFCCLWKLCGGTIKMPFQLERPVTGFKSWRLQVMSVKCGDLIYCRTHLIFIMVATCYHHSCDMVWNLDLEFTICELNDVNFNLTYDETVMYFLLCYIFHDGPFRSASDWLHLVSCRPVELRPLVSILRGHSREGCTA